MYACLLVCLYVCMIECAAERMSACRLVLVDVCMHRCISSCVLSLLCMCRGTQRMRFSVHTHARVCTHAAASAVLRACACMRV